MNVDLNQVIRMMLFLNMETYVIPSHGLPAINEANGDNYRPERLYRLYRNGYMQYYGCAYEKVPAVNLFGLTPPQRYIDRAYLFLKDDIKKELRKRSDNFEVQKLILKFNGLGFVDIR